MNFPVPSMVISSILGYYGPLAKVTANWPLVEASLDTAGIYSPLCAVAAIATISVETGRFNPTKERGGPTYLTKFQGRGFIPIVGRREYEHFGMEIGKDLAGKSRSRAGSRDRRRNLRSLFQGARRPRVRESAKLGDGQAASQCRSRRMAAVHRRGDEVGVGSEKSPAVDGGHFT
jgi:hypothetical protein